MENHNSISKHIEITVNLSNFENIKIGTYLNLEIQEGEGLEAANTRMFNNLQAMMRDDIERIFQSGSYLRENALEMIGISTH